MELLVIVFYLLALCCGVYLGWVLGYERFDDDVFLRICGHIQEKMDEVESRLQDGDYSGLNDHMQDVGRMDAYQGLLEYIDKEIVKKK